MPRGTCGRGRDRPDLDATIGRRAPDASAPQKVEKNPAINEREIHPPPQAELRRETAEMLKIDGDPAAPDDQDPDAPERPTAEENELGAC